MAIVTNRWNKHTGNIVPSVDGTGQYAERGEQHGLEVQCGGHRSWRSRSAEIFRFLAKYGSETKYVSVEYEGISLAFQVIGVTFSAVNFSSYNFSRYITIWSDGLTVNHFA